MQGRAIDFPLQARLDREPNKIEDLRALKFNKHIIILVEQFPVLSENVGHKLKCNTIVMKATGHSLYQ